MAASKHNKIKLREVNRHLVCRLCRGYYVDATTIAECLHSFCRSCIIKYLEKNSFCPICEVQIHKTKPYLNLRLDKALQDVVYKVVPGLYHDEMKRRREFYAKRQEQIPFATPEQCGLEERIIFSPEDSISLSLEYLERNDFESEAVSSQSSESGENSDVLSFPQQLGLIKLKNNGEGKTSRRESQDVQETTYPKRYLQCPAVVNVSHLKKFVRMKHDLTDKMQVSIIHKRVPLPDHYTLMDVAYIFTWKRSAPLRFFYQIYQTKKQKLKVSPNSSEKDLKLLNSEPESLKNIADEKLLNGDIAKSPVEGKKSVKSDMDKSFISEPKQTVQPKILKNLDSNKLTVETKLDASVKSESSLIRETKEGFETDMNGGVTRNNSDLNKCEKTKANGVGVMENKNKSESQKRKAGKVESVSNAREMKENETNNRERVLLNPTSGQLETVPSSEQLKPVVNVGNVVSEKKETKETLSKETTNTEQKKTDSQTPKDSKKSNVNLLKSFRKEKMTAGKDGKMEIKNGGGNSLTITPVSKAEKTPEKDSTVRKFSMEVKADNKESEYDFDGSSPPGKIIPLQEFSKYSKYSKYMTEHRDKWLTKESKNNWMSLKDFREKMLNEEDMFKKNKKKEVPSLYKINSEGHKMRKTPSGLIVSEKPKGNKTPTIINIKTECEDKKAEVKVEIIEKKGESPPKPIKIENKEGSVKPTDNTKSSTADDTRPTSELSKPTKGNEDEETKSSGSAKDPLKGGEGEMKEKAENQNVKSVKDATKNESVGAMDLTKVETTPKSSKNPLENLMDFTNKTGIPKGDEKLVEALLSAAQKQSIEPLLKIPQYSQILKNSSAQGSLSPGKNISPNEISQALQFLEDLRSDIKILEAKNQLNSNSVLEQFAQKSANFEPYQQLYQQKIDLIRRLKRHQQIMPNDSDTPHKKHMKLSPTSESKKKPSPTSEQKTNTSPVLDEVAQYKSSLDKTLSQIQLMELQSRMIAAHNYKNLPGLLQYYNRTPSFCPGSTSPTKFNQQKIKPSSHSPNKSPQGLSSSSGNSHSPNSNSDSSFFNSQSYTHLINAGLNSEMTYHQMFQSYLNQQEQMNQVKLSQMPKKSVKLNETSPKSISEKYYSPQTNFKKQEGNSPVASLQKT